MKHRDLELYLLPTLTTRRTSSFLKLRSSQSLSKPLYLIKLQTFHKRPPLLCLLVQVFIKLYSLVCHLGFVLINNPIHLQHTKMIIPSPRIGHLVEKFGIVISFLNAKHSRFLSLPRLLIITIRPSNHVKRTPFLFLRDFFQREKVLYWRSQHSPLIYLHFRKAILPFLSIQ